MVLDPLRVHENSIIITVPVPIGNATKRVRHDNVLEGLDVRFKRLVNHVSNLRGITLGFFGVLPNTLCMSKGVLAITHLKQKRIKSGIQTSNSPRLQNGVSCFGPVSSNEAIHATIETGI